MGQGIQNLWDSIQIQARHARGQYSLIARHIFRVDRGVDGGGERGENKNFDLATTHNIHLAHETRGYRHSPEC